MGDDLRERADRLPDSPGVYLFKNRRGTVLYVGKARSLRARVRQYMGGHDARPLVPYLVRDATDVDAVVVATDAEALILENTLIKKHRPRYNVKLTDDASFLHLRIDPRAAWPDWHLVRRIRETRARHFGPFASATRARATLEFLQRNFPLRTCSDSELRSRTRPCLLHQMHRCIAPCVGLCTREQYEEVVAQSILFLEGRRQELVERVAARMGEEAAAERFEEAARLRDLVRAIEASTERQSVVDRKLGDRDAWGLWREGERGTATVLPVRRGMMQEVVPLPFDGFVGSDGELLSSVLNAWYGEGSDVPPEILVPALPEDAAALSDVLAARRGGPVGIHVPERGEKAAVARIAAENARTADNRAHDEEEKRERALAELAKVCRLPAPPRRIECYDNSNLAGRDPVASRVAFVDGRPARALYRRYRVKTVIGSDDYATMREILGRRFRRVGQEGEDAPDLIVVDGGQGQVSAARAALEELGVAEQAVIGLAKPRTEHRKGDREATDKIVLPGVRDPIRLPPNSPALTLLQALRDEAHRTAIGYHRTRRSKRQLVSVLESIPGLGPARARALLERFGSARGVAEAGADRIAEVPGFGPALARRVAEALR